MKTRCDVAIIGAGPAGTTAATILSAAGLHVQVFERDHFPRYHIGESLIPQSYDALARLGMLEKLRGSHFPEKYSVRFTSVEGHDSSAFYFDETIPGERSRTWQIERAEFDLIMLENAQKKGVIVTQGASVKRVLFDGERATGLEMGLESGETLEIESKVVLDTSGRDAVLAKQLRMDRKVPGLNKGSLWSYYKGARRRPGRDAGETAIYMLPNKGWFWFIPLPNDITSVGIVDDPERLFVRGKDPVSILEEKIKECPALRKALGKAERVSKVRGLPVLAHHSARMSGEGYLLAGDSYTFLDPIYSSGLLLAMESGRLAADSILQAFEDDDFSGEKLGSFRVALDKGVESVRKLIYAFYDPSFSFGEFNRRHPDQRAALIDILAGDVFKDMTGVEAALATMSPPPIPLSELNSNGGGPEPLRPAEEAKQAQ